jgi:hypothetical protein
MRLEPSTADKVFNREMVNSAMGEVRYIIESRYEGELIPLR